jgi:septal ring factor EnvC (AmiA/AmiB activator)
MTAQTQPPPGSTSQGRRTPWGWIVLSVVLVAAVIALAIWAIGLQGDLNDQKDATAQAQQQAETAQTQVDSISGQLDDLTNQVNDASDQLQQAGSDAQQNTEQALSDIQGKLTGLQGAAKDAIAKLKGAAGSGGG